MGNIIIDTLIKTAMGSGF